MTAPAVVMADQCCVCSRWRPPMEIWTRPGNSKICPQCRQRQEKAMRDLPELIAGNPVGCAVCDKKPEELKILSGRDDYPLYIHWRDGVYMPHCQQCHDEYTPKRRDLYGKTEFGKSLK